MSTQHPLFTEKQRVPAREVSEPPNGAFTLGNGSHFALGLFVTVSTA
jgi:hypothetical protein